MRRSWPEGGSHDDDNEEIPALGFVEVPLFDGSGRGGARQTKEPTARRKDIITEAEAHCQIGMAYLREPQNTGQAVEYHFRLAEAYTADFPFSA